MTSYREVNEDAQRDYIVDTLVGIVQEAEQLLAVARDQNNSVAAIAEFATPLIDQVFALELSLENSDPDSVDFEEEE